MHCGGIKRLGIPTVAFSDGPRGVVMGKSTCFPVSMARGASFNDELEYEVGTAIAKEVIAGGANYFAGICINLLRNPRWGRAQETYGEDPFLLGKMGAARQKRCRITALSPVQSISPATALKTSDFRWMSMQMKRLCRRYISPISRSALTPARCPLWVPIIF